MQAIRNRTSPADLLLVMALTIAAVVMANDPVRPLQGSAFGYYVGHQLE